MAGRWGRYVGAGISCTAVTACSLLNSLADFSSGGPGPGLLDGGDGASNVDGAAGGDAKADGGGPPCDASFCDDFERDALQGPWSAVHVESDGQLEIVAVDAGRGRALWSRRLNGSASNTPRAYLSKELGAGTKVEYTLDLHVVGSIPNYAIFCSIEADQGGGRSGAVWLREQGTSIAAFSGYQDPVVGYTAAGSELSKPFVLGEWQRVVISLELAPTPPSRYTVKINGITVVDQPTIGDLSALANLSVRAGLSATDGVPDSFNVLVDNVRVNVTP